MIKEALTSGLPKATFFYAFNTRRPVFADVRVREAISLLFDFEWINHNLFFDLYRRSASYFEGSELSARGRPADARERALLAPFPGAVRPDVLEGIWSPPVSDGSGRDRSIMRRALALLAQAGYELRGGVLVQRQSGAPLTFEIMIANRNDAPDEERLALMFASNLKRAGIAARVRLVDAVQFETRRIDFDFDMIENRWDQTLSPGNEQAFYWSSARSTIRNGQPQLYRRLECGRRRGPRCADALAHAPRCCLRGARPRPPAHLRFLFGAALPCARRMGRALDANPASCRDLAVRLPPGDVVAAAKMRRWP